jgi:hypothetical protein
MCLSPDGSTIAASDGVYIFGGVHGGKMLEKHPLPVNTDISNSLKEKTLSCLHWNPTMHLLV